MKANIDFLLWESEHFRIEHSTYYRIAGFLFVIPAQPAAGIAELSLEASSDLGHVLRLASEAVVHIVAPERIYISSFGESGTGLHFHIFPRTRDLTKAYLAANDTGPELDGPGIMSWANNRYINGIEHGDINGTQEALRKHFQSPPNF